MDSMTAGWLVLISCGSKLGRDPRPLLSPVAGRTCGFKGAVVIVRLYGAGSTDARLIERRDDLFE
jgi:hypothetical protein